MGNGFRETEHERFGGSVHCHAGDGLERGRAGHVDQGPGSGGEQAGKEGPGDINKRSHVEGYFGGNDIRLFLDEWRVGSEACVVDERVHGDPTAADFLEKFFANAGAAQVHGQHRDGDAVLGAELLCQLLHPVRTSRDQDGASTPGSKLSGELGAES